MAKGDKYSPSIEFYVNSFSNEEYRDPKVGIENSTRVSFVDDKKKNQSEKDWTPISNSYLTLVNSQKPNLKFGKKYKITFEEL